MSSLAIISYFKDEAHILNEWISHHLSFGIEHFYLLNNNSLDRFTEVLDKYEGKYTLIDSHSIPQLEAYKKAYRIAQSRHEWISFIDLDEFLYVKNVAKSIPRFLDTLDARVQAVCVYWKVFLPTHFYQPRSVIKSSTRSCREDGVAVRPFKSIFRTSLQSDKLAIHCPRGLKSIEKEICLPSNSLLRLNHYRFQSYEYLLGVKAQRGGGVNKSKYKAGDSIALLKQYFALEPEHSYDLMNLSQEITDKIETEEQIRPSVDVYNSASWSSLVSGTRDLDNLSPLDLFKKVLDNFEGD
jgi:hypothetical protein